jgi:hypothetical protein
MPLAHATPTLLIASRLVMRLTLRHAAPTSTAMKATSTPMIVLRETRIFGVDFLPQAVVVGSSRQQPRVFIDGATTSCNTETREKKVQPTRLNTLRFS